MHHGRPRGNEIRRYGHPLARRKFWKAGDRKAEALLFEAVRPRLIRLADYLLRRERPSGSLQPSLLISELYLRVANMASSDLRGAPDYIAPERWLGKPASAASDV